MFDKNYLKGRGAQFNPSNKFLKEDYDIYFEEGIDWVESMDEKTSFIHSKAKSLVHRVESPDLHLEYSANPYQGCEHGCIYCYARNSHQYWDLSSGLDFEKKIIVKENAPQLFEKFITRKNWDFSPIHLSGNTDCYQPAERKYKLTRQILQIALTYEQPISIITKNALILRDIDILADLASKGLVKVVISITTLNEDTRQKLEPRTVTAKQKLKIIEKLTSRQIPVGVNVAPIIPGLTDHEIPAILKASASVGAKWANYIIVRLNGQIGEVFKDWLHMTFPDRANKIWNAISSCHHGQVNNSIFGERMRGTGAVAEIIRSSFNIHSKLHGLNSSSFQFNKPLRKDQITSQLSLF